MPIIATADVPVTKRGIVMGSLTATMAVGSIIVPFATSTLRGVINNDGAWREIWLLETASAAIILAIVYFVLRGNISTPLPLGAGIKAINRLQAWKIAVFFYMAFAFVAASWFQFFGLSLESDHGMSREFTTQLWALMGVGGVVGAVIFGRLSDRFGRPRTMCLVTAIGATTCLLSSSREHMGSSPRRSPIRHNGHGSSSSDRSICARSSGRAGLHSCFSGQ